VLRLSIALTAAATIVALIFDRVVAQGLLLGGLAGTAAFWMLARRWEVETASANGVKSRTRMWLATRLLVYATVLYVAYNLDKVHVRGLLAAAAGLLIVRIAVTIVGVTGWDLKEPEQ
jgi:hypothetical protein